MGMTCIIVEKPSVARELAAIVGADSRGNGHMERNYQDPRTCFGQSPHRRTHQ